MKSIEVYKGFSIFEAEGKWAEAGFRFQIDLSPVRSLSSHKFFGTETLDKARIEIDFLAEMR